MENGNRGCPSYDPGETDPAGTAGSVTGVWLRKPVEPMAKRSTRYPMKTMRFSFELLKYLMEVTDGKFVDKCYYDYGIEIILDASIRG
jgi:hypothetical protein